jgi:hypothetical protein
MNAQLPDMILTIIVLSFWVLFPVGTFLSVSHMDKTTYQLLRLDKLRHESEAAETPEDIEGTDIPAAVIGQKTYRPDVHA